MVRSVEQNNTKADTKGDHANEVIKIPKKNKWEREKGGWPEHGAVRGHGDKVLFFFTCVALLKTMLQDCQIFKKKKIWKTVTDIMTDMISGNNWINQITLLSECDANRENKNDWTTEK